MAFVVVRLRGTVHIKKDLARTLRLLRLNKKHNCIIVPETKEILGMIKKVSNVVTWGEINEKTASKLLSKRGRLPGNKRITEGYLKEKVGKTIEEAAKDIANGALKVKDVPGLKPVFRLKPPSKGLERKGLKAEYSMGGSFGYRGNKINDFLMRMV